MRPPPRPDMGYSMTIPCSFVFMNFSGYSVKERIGEPEVRVRAILLPQRSAAEAPGLFPGVGREEFSRSFVFINIAGCTFIFVEWDKGHGTRDNGYGIRDIVLRNGFLLICVAPARIWDHRWNFPVPLFS